MLKIRSIVNMASIAVMMTGAVNSYGQNYPGRPIRIITSDAGGGSDIVTRLIAQGITAPLGQPVIVENRSGGVIAGETVMKAAPDGHTLLYYGNSLWVLPLLRKSVPYEALRDFVPISFGVAAPTVLTIHPSLPVKSIKELIAIAKARPGQLNYGSSAIGTTNHLSAELFKAMAGVNIVRVGYKGGGALMNDLLAGQIQIAFAVISTSLPQVGSGRLRALAVTGAQPSPQAPELPTIAASGVPGYESLSISGMFAPARTPEAIVNRLNREIVTVLHNPDFKSRFVELGVEPVGSTAQEFTDKIKSEIAIWGKLIRESGMRDE